MTNPRPLTLRPHELRRLRDTGSVCVVRAMRKQPECLGIPATARLAGSCYTFTHDGYWWATKSKPPGEVGDVVAVKEAWQFYDWTEDGEPFLRYAADNSVALAPDFPDDDWSDRLSDTWEELSRDENFNISNRACDNRWRSPATMPPSAVRTFAVLASVRPGQVQGVTEAEAEAVGLRKFPFEDSFAWAFRDDDQHGHASPTGAFHALHDAHTRNPAHKWERNPWCFIGVFQLRGDE